MKPARQESPYEAALLAALNDLSKARQAARGARMAATTADRHARELVQLARSLLATMPDEIAHKHADELRRLCVVPDVNSSRVTPLHENVIEVFAGDKAKDWRPSEVQEELAARGKAIEPKALLNVMNYLARSGRLQRHGRGLYRAAEYGVGFVTSEDFE